MICLNSWASSSTEQESRCVVPRPAVLFASDTDDAGRRELARAAARGELLRRTAENVGVRLLLP